MQFTGDKNMEKPYMNPYLAGILLGLVLIAAFFISGRGLGASGAMKSTVVTAVHTVAPDYAEHDVFYSKYLKNGQKPMKAWLVFEVLGVFLGGFLSGAFSGRLKLTIEKGPRITDRKRLILALIGGVLFGLGSQLGRGCTSGSALTGMAVLSTAGFLSMVSIFGTGYVFAYFFRKNWL